MRLPRLTSILLLGCLAITLANADKKERDWKTGKVLDMDSASFRTYGGTNTQGQINSDGTYSEASSQSSWNHKKYVFAIKGDDMIYVVSHVLSFRWSKKVELTVNGSVKFAVEKGKFYLIDENDREFKMKIEKKILIEKDQP